MNANLYVIVSALTVGLLSVLLNITGRQKYKDNATFFEQANHELREQNNSLRQDKADLSENFIKAQAESTQKDAFIKKLEDINARLPDYTALNEKSSEVIKLISNNQKEVMNTSSNNHKEIMQTLSGLARKITGKIDGTH